MSTADGSVRAPRGSEDVKQNPQKPPSTFFPLGYKDAAYQWVSSETILALDDYPLHRG